MVEHLNEEEITEINRLCLEISGEFEEKHDLEKEFFRITCIEDEEKKSEEIKSIMDSKYGKTIEKLFKNNFIKN